MRHITSLISLALILLANPLLAQVLQKSEGKNVGQPQDSIDRKAKRRTSAPPSCLAYRTKGGDAFQIACYQDTAACADAKTDHQKNLSIEVIGCAPQIHCFTYNQANKSSACYLDGDQCSSERNKLAGSSGGVGLCVANTTAGAPKTQSAQGISLSPGVALTATGKMLDPSGQPTKGEALDESRHQPPSEPPRPAIGVALDDLRRQPPSGLPKPGRAAALDDLPRLRTPPGFSRSGQVAAIDDARHPPSPPPAPTNESAPPQIRGSSDSSVPKETQETYQQPQYQPGPQDTQQQYQQQPQYQQSQYQQPQYQQQYQQQSLSIQSPLQQQPQQYQQPVYQGQQMAMAQPYQGQPGIPLGNGAPGFCTVKLSADRSTIQMIDSNTGTERKHLSLGQDRVQKIFSSPDNAWSVAVYKIRGVQQYGFIALELASCEDHLPVELAAVPSAAKFDQSEVVLTIEDKEKRFPLKNSRMQ